MKNISFGYPEISAKRTEQGTRLLVCAEALRILERWWYAGSIQVRWPSLAMDGFPLSQSPIEIWDPLILHSSHFLGLILCALAWVLPGWKRVGVPISLLLFNILLAPGGSNIAKALVLLQPAILAFIILNSGKRFSFIPLWLLGTLYGFNGVSKFGPEWMDGTAVSLFLTSTLWSIGLPEAPAGIFWKSLTYGTLAWEYAGFLLLVPLRHPVVNRFRSAYLYSAIAFHGILFVISPFRVLGLTAVSLLWVLLPEKEEEGLPPERRGARPLMIAWGLWLFLSNLNHFGVDIGRPAKIFFSKLSLYPSWALFSPSPHSGSVRAILSEPGSGPVAYDKRPEISLLLDAYRFPVMWEYFSERICSGKTGRVTLTIERKGIPGPLKEWDCTR